jgi:hypothetical protein
MERQAMPWTTVRRSIRATRRTSCVLLAASCALFIVGMLHIGCATVVAHTLTCMSNMKQLGMGMQLYMQDYDERLPACVMWDHAVESRLAKAGKQDDDSVEHPFQCPAATSPASYGMNAALSAAREADVDSPAQTVLLFDADAPTRSFAGGPHDLARSRHDNMPVVVFLNGHAEWANRFTEDAPNWNIKMPNAKARTAGR